MEAGGWARFDGQECKMKPDSVNQNQGGIHEEAYRCRETVARVLQPFVLHASITSAQPKVPQNVSILLSIRLG